MSESDAVSRGRRAAGTNESLDSRDDGGYAVTTTVFEGQMAVDADDGAVVVTVTATVPMLDAVTEESVAPVVEEGWFETLELRIGDVDGAIRGDDVTVSVRQVNDGAAAVVEAELRDLDATRAVADAVAVVEYVEGTYVEGIIPGYEYTEPVSSLIQRAADAAGGRKGGTPL